MIRLVPLYGTGDTYLICALARAFEAHHQVPVTVVVKRAHACVAEAFGIAFEADDAPAAIGENPRQQATYPNEIASGLLFVHPSFVKTPARLDQLTVKPRVSQADMYRALLQLPPWAPLATPSWEKFPKLRDVVLLTESRSWPNLPGPFWEKLLAALYAGGRRVTLNDPAWSLRDLLDHCAAAGTVIGPQCGVISIACEAGFPGHKTIVLRELTPGSPYLFGLSETMPYGHASTFAGNPHPEVGHVVVGGDWDSAIKAVLDDCTTF